MKQVVTWEEYFMGLAQLSALRSKDGNTKVGSCIVNGKNRIVGIGYNGFPNGCDDSEFPWGTEGDFTERKYAYVVHAELNAILNATRALDGCRIYTSLFPCNECCKAIIQSGIVEVIYLSDKYRDTPSSLAARKMLDAAGVIYREYAGSRQPIELNLTGC